MSIDIDAVKAKVDDKGLGSLTKAELVLYVEFQSNRADTAEAEAEAKKKKDEKSFLELADAINEPIIPRTSKEDGRGHPITLYGDKVIIGTFDGTRPCIISALELVKTTKKTVAGETIKETQVSHGIRCMVAEPDGSAIVPKPWSGSSRTTGKWTYFFESSPNADPAVTEKTRVHDMNRYFAIGALYGMFQGLETSAIQAIAENSIIKAIGHARAVDISEETYQKKERS
jgi:hypothetical protein